MKSTIKSNRIKMPICPYCEAEMKPVTHQGFYYGSFTAWQCKCERFPNKEKQTG
jgi:hypothetical protein